MLRRIVYSNGVDRRVDRRLVSLHHQRFFPSLTTTFHVDQPHSQSKTRPGPIRAAGPEYAPTKAKRTGEQTSPPALRRLSSPSYLGNPSIPRPSHHIRECNTKSSHQPGMTVLPSPAMIVPAFQVPSFQHNHPCMHIIQALCRISTLVHASAAAAKRSPCVR